MRRRVLSAVLTGALAVSLGVLPATAQPATTETACPDGAPRAPFTDVSADNVHATAIDCAYERELVAGVSATQYAPSRAVTRAQAASLVARTLDEAGVALPPETEGREFSDVPAAHAANVRRLEAAGVVQGRTDGTYGGSLPVSREQFASLMVRALSFARGLDVLATVPDRFDDVDSAAHQANVAAAYEQGLVQGRQGGLFAPRADTRRDQAATVVNRLLVELGRGGDFLTSGGEVWALDQGTDRIHIYDGNDGFAERLVIDVSPAALDALGFPDAPTGARTVPHMIEFDSQQRYAFIAATAGGVTIVVDARSKEVVEVLATGPGTHMAAVTPDDSAVWVAVIGDAGRHPTVGSGDDLRDANPRRMTEIPLDLDAPEPVFAVDRELDLEDLLAPLEAANGWEYPSFSPVCHQYTSDSTEAWITLGPSWNQGALVVLDLESGTLVDTSGLDPAVVRANCGVSVTDEQVIVNWSGRVEAGNDSSGEWYVIDPDTYQLVEGGIRDAEGFDTHGLRLTPDGTSYWQVNRITNDALVIDAQTLEVTRRLPDIADTPDILDYSPEGSVVYITQRGPDPRSGGVHAASGDQPGVAIVDVASGRRLGVLQQPAVTGSGEGKINDVHGVGVRVPQQGDTWPETADVALASFDARPVERGIHCSLPASI